MITTVQKRKLIYHAKQIADFNVSSFNGNSIIISISNYYSALISNKVNLLVNPANTLSVVHRLLPNIQAIFNQFISNPNTNAINLYFAVLCQFANVSITELGKLQTVPAGVSNYLISDTIPLLSLSSDEAQNSLTQVQVAFMVVFPANTGTSALTFNSVVSPSSAPSTIKLLV